MTISVMAGLVAKTGDDQDSGDWHGFSIRQFRGNKGALRIPSLSFQYLRRPGCTAKLLCFHIAGGFDPHRPYQFSYSIHRTWENCEAAKGSINSGAGSARE